MKTLPVNSNSNTGNTNPRMNNKVSFKEININLSIFLTNLAQRANCLEANLTVMRIHRLDRFMSKFNVKGDYKDSRVLVSGHSKISDDDVMLIDQKIERNTPKPLEALKFIENEYKKLLDFYHKSQ